MNAPLTAKEQQDIAQALVEWFHLYGKDYPWRRTADPWAILASEIMLQQTTIPTVLGRYEVWMRQFPTPEALATAPEDVALRSWEGLGYYRRIRALQAAAKVIVERHEGRFPTTHEEIRALPGVGDYTAGAVQSFAFNRPVPLVDANVSRVFARLANDFTPIDSPAGRKAHWALAASMIHPTNPRAYNSALMELGQTICTNGEPTCLICPIRPWCRAEHPAHLPIKLPAPKASKLEHWDIFCLTPRGLLMQQQPSGKRHEGFFRLPTREKKEVESLPHLTDQTYSVTRYKVVRHVYRAAETLTPREGEQYLPLAQLPSAPMASPDRKIIAKILNVNIS